MTKLSLGVIRKDKELLLLPIISASVMAILVVAVVAPLTLFGAVETPAAALAYIALYFTLAFIAVYFNVCIIAIATIRLKGGEPTIRDGFAVANRHLGAIAKWSLLVATVGLALRLLRQYLEREAGILGSILAWATETAWALMTFFMIPVLIYEDRPLFESLRRSGRLFKKTWGETLITGFFLGIIFLLFILAGFVPVALGFYLIVALGNMLLGVGLLVLGVCLIVVLVSMYYAAQGVVIAALYIYATEGVVPEDFAEADLRT